MASNNSLNFPYFPPPLTPNVSPPIPTRPIRPPPPPPPPPPPVTPPPPAHPVRPPPPPPVTPSPPPRPIRPPPPPPVIPPPKPHPITPPPPPSPPDHHSTVIIIVFVSFGCLLFLACSLLALWCFLKKRKKKAVEEIQIVNIDEHLKIKEAIVKGHHGPKTVVLSVEDDVHISEVDTKKSKSLGEEQNMHAKSEETTPSSLEEGRSSSSPSHQHSKQNPS